MNPYILALPPDVPFLPSLAREWLDQAAHHRRDPADGLLILPTRRAARAAAAAFLEVHGKPLILPRITAIGALDEAALALAGALELPPAILPQTRRTILARLILAAGGRDGAPTRLADALLLADELSLLIDEAEQAEIDLRERLRNIVAPELAAHWQRTIDFLEIVAHAWPAILTERGVIDASRRHRMLLDAEATRLTEQNPTHPVWLAGVATASPALGRLARAIAGLEHGAVVLAGYDADLPDPAWDALDDAPTHPQAGLKRLLTAIGAKRGDVLLRPASTASVPQGRIALLRRAFLPAGFLSAWQDGLPAKPEEMLRLEAEDEQDEARAIALLLRDTLENPTQTAALVTPDRGLAVRVAAELSRFGIRAEDSAGESLANSPPATFLRLLARAVEQDLASVPLLALLKHPLAAVGRKPSECRAMTRVLDLLLRHQPQPGFAGLRFAAERENNAELVDFISELQTRLRPITEAMALQALPPPASLDALIAAAEALAASDDSPGPARLWAEEAGGELAAHLSAALQALDEALPDVPPAELPALLDALLAGATLRRPRTQDAEPRVAIWGIMEARLQNVDTLILGGMVEGVFPAEPDPGPFLSRPMRHDAGLPDASERIGEMAQDVANLISTCPRVVFSAPKRRGRAPAIASRFLLRVETMLNGAGEALLRHPAASWAAQLDRAQNRVIRPAPHPRPPASSRPVRYSISDVATLLADPYAIYARRILRLEPLDPLDAEIDTALFGNVVHQGLAEIASAPGALAAPDAAEKLAAAFERILRENRVRLAVGAFWRVRLARIAEWIVALDRERPPALAVATERPGAWRFDRFTIHGRADRIERRTDGGIAIIDYKTGSPPQDEAVEAGASPQLPMEAVIAEAGGFGADVRGTVVELAYWKLTGGATEGHARVLFNGDMDRLAAVIEQARERIPALLAHYADAKTPFLDTPHPGRKPYDQPFAGVSRRAEWEDAP